MSYFALSSHREHYQATKPVVSVLMPVFNGEKYLAEAIESILNQSFTDFEFLIINDGSTDGTDEILAEYVGQDKRIKIIHNEKNIGIAASRNRCNELVQGEYIAQMDADDVSLPERLAVQVAYLQEHLEVTAVFSKILLFPGKGTLRYWNDDQENVTSDQIRRTLPRTCCVANPTLLIRAHVLKKYQYDEGQVLSADWALWLRLISDDHRLAKVDRELLRYRIHDASVTQKSFRNDGLRRKIYACRNHFLEKQAASGKWEEVEQQAFHHHVAFLLKHFGLAEMLTLYPHCFRLSVPEETACELVINFRKINEGGVERVITTWANEFTKRGYVVTLLTDEEPAGNDYPLTPTVRRVTIPRNDEYLENFHTFAEANIANTYIINDDYTELCYKKMLLLKILGKRVIVANHGVWHVPAHPDTRWQEAWKSRPAVFDLMDAVVCLSLADKAYWNWAGLKNVLYIPNPLPFETLADQRAILEQPLIVWVGRFGEEKQPELMIELFEQIKQRVPDATLCMLGDGVLLERCKEKAAELGIAGAISFPGFVGDVQRYLRQASVHCITSRYEGFPMSWLEAKAFGVPTVLFRLSNLEMSFVPGAMSIERYDSAAFINQVERLLNDLPARKEMGAKAFLSLDEFSRVKVFGRWELLFRLLPSQQKLSFDAFVESCPSERLNEILFDQTTQLMNDWMKYSCTEKGIKQLARELLEAILQRKFIFLKKVIRFIRRRVHASISYYSCI